MPSARLCTSCPSTKPLARNGWGTYDQLLVQVLQNSAHWVAFSFTGSVRSYVM